MVRVQFLRELSERGLNRVCGCVGRNAQPAVKALWILSVNRRPLVGRLMLFTLRNGRKGFRVGGIFGDEILFPDAELGQAPNAIGIIEGLRGRLMHFRIHPRRSKARTHFRRQAKASAIDYGVHPKSETR